MLSDVPYIETYRGFASETRVIFNCRLLKDRNHYATSEDGLWNNIKNVFRKVASREIPFGNIQIQLQDHTHTLKSDHEGYVFMDAPIRLEKSVEPVWNSIQLRSLNHQFQCEYILPSSEVSYGIISDIDDTILVTDVHQPVKMLINSLFRNPFQREAFEGLRTFYEHKTHHGINPVFYLSNSPWNLYKNIKQFLEIQHLPKGPILLRDYGMHFPNVPHSFVNHKEINIELILEVYPHLPFVLIGDASQEDALIYSHMKQKYPHRIKEILIRKIDDPGKMEKLYEHPEVDVNAIRFFSRYEELV